METGVVRVAALGDFGSGDQFQARVARALCDRLTDEPFTHVVTTGDNIYPFGDPRDFEPNFFEPYQCLFDAGVRWHASLGNHDAFTGGGQAEIDEPAFGMRDSYYTWRLGPLTFVMLDSNDFDDAQLEWLDRALDKARAAPWTIVAFHHPVYGAGLHHGSTEGFEEMFASRFDEAGVDLVLNGHDHLYTRATDGGVTYLVTGGGGATLDVCRIPMPDPVDQCFSTLHFVAIEATRSALTTTAIMDTGKVIETVKIDPND